MVTLKEETLGWLAENAAEEIRLHKNAMWREITSFTAISGFLISQKDKFRTGDPWLLYIALTVIFILLHFHRDGKISKFRTRLHRIYKKWNRESEGEFERLRSGEKKDEVKNKDNGDCFMFFAGLAFYVILAIFTSKILGTP